VTQSSVKVYVMPVSGLYGGARKRELSKTLTVVDDTITIKVSE
jgi:hypothetical protein